MGQGNKVETTQPNPNEPPVQKPVFALTYDDQVYLAKTLYRPIARDAEKLRALKYAACAWELRQNHIKWEKTLGEAIDEKKCELRGFAAYDAYDEPAVRIAFAELLLEGHPKKAELLNQVRLFTARTRGAPVSSLCYGIGERGIHQKESVSDGCTEPWTFRHDDASIFFVSTIAITPKALEDLRVRDLDEMAYFLGQVDPASSSGAEAKQLLDQVNTLRPLRDAKRKKTLASLRAKNPKNMSIKQIGEDGNENYLYHRLCSERTNETEVQGVSVVHFAYQCVTIAYEDENHCYEIGVDFRKYRGDSEFDAVASDIKTTKIPCP